MHTVVIEEARREGTKTLAVEKDGKKKYLHSRYDPIEEANRWAASQIEEKPKEYILFGAGLGYPAQALLERMDEKSSLLIVEPLRAIYERVKETELFQKLLEDPRFSLYCPDGDTKPNVSMSDILSHKKVFRFKVIAYSPYETAFSEEYHQFVQWINEYLVAKKIEDNTTNHFAIDHMVNLFCNLYYSAQSVFAMEFREKFKDKIAVIVSAGPSLDKNIDLLKGNEDKLIILSGGRTLKTLLDRGIRPHFAVTFDPHYFNFLLIKDVLDAEVPLVLSFLSNREIAHNYKGKKIFLNNTGIDGFGQFFFDQHVDTLRASGTVASVQLSFAHYLGCRKIVLIGQDLAYTGGKAHSDSTLWLKQEQDGANEFDLQKDGFIKVKGNVEEIVYTEPSLYGFLKVFRAMVESMTDCEIYNCTEGGAYIEGTKVMPLGEFLKEFCQGEPQDYYGQIDEIIENAKKEISVQEIKRRIHSLQRDSYAVMKLCDEAAAITAKNIRSRDENERDKKKLKKLNNKINRLTGKFDIAHILSNNILEQIGQVEMDDSKSLEEQEQDIRKLNRIFYASVKGIYMGFNYIMQEVLDTVFKEEDSDEKEIKSEEGKQIGKQSLYKISRAGDQHGDTGRVDTDAL